MTGVTFERTVTGPSLRPARPRPAATMPPQPPPQGDTVNEQPAAKPKTGCVSAGCGGVVLIFVVIILAAIFSDGDSGKKSDDKPMSESAAVMCEEFVKKRLKSPGSAEFPDPFDSDYATTKVLSKTKPWKYRVTGVVDSENSFGALARIDYVCTVSTKDDDTWTLDDMDMTQR